MKYTVYILRQFYANTAKKYSQWYRWCGNYPPHVVIQIISVTRRTNRLVEIVPPSRRVVE